MDIMNCSKALAGISVQVYFGSKYNLYIDGAISMRMILKQNENIFIVHSQAYDHYYLYSCTFHIIMHHHES